MGTTRDAMAGGSFGYVWVAAIEGYPHLLTNGDTSAVSTAFAGLLDYATALPGLFVELDNHQRLHPYEPFGSGGTCTLTVAPNAADTFGIDVHRKSAGWQTELTETANHEAATLHVQSTAAAPSSGTLYIGGEAVIYSGKTATTFTGCTRGVYSPFKTSAGPARMAAYHQVGTSPDAVDLKPVVSEQPRSWIGRRVGVWMCRSSGGVLDVVAQSQLVFAGRIVEIRDDPNTAGTVLQLAHVLDEFKTTAIGRDMWRAKIPAGIRLYPGMVFRMKDTPNFPATAYKAAGSLEVVEGASGYDEIEPGMYTVEQILSIFEQWWAGAYALGDLHGTYSIDVDTTGEPRTKITSFVTATSGNQVRWELRMPRIVAVLLGFSDQAFDESTALSESLVFMQYPASATPAVRTSDHQPKRAIIFNGFATGADVDFDQNRLEYVEPSGTFFDSFGLMPAAFPVAGASWTSAYQWGIFLFDDSTLMYGAIDEATQELGALRVPNDYSYLRGDPKQFHAMPWDQNASEHISVRQIVILQSTGRNVVNSLAYSTGTPGHNRAGFDAFPYGYGLGIPGDLLGPAWEATVSGMPGADDAWTLIIDKPMTIEDLIGGECVLRRMFVLWRGQGLRIGSWRAPTATAFAGEGGPLLTLAEDNKAEPAGSETNQRSAATLTDEWQRPIVKILYDRDFGQLGADSYASTITLHDQPAISDAGGSAPVLTVKARNMSGDIEVVASNFLATMPMFSRPARKVARSIDSRYWETIAVGDVVLFADGFARDPSTGRRGISARPALVIEHRWNPGGAVPNGGTSDMGGEVVLFFTDQNTALSGALYAPAADVDDTANTGGFTGGYDSGSNTLRCYEHHYNQETEYYINGFPVLDDEPSDASYFPATYKVRIIERDPLDMTAPQLWERTVASQTGNDIVLSGGALTGFDADKRYRVVFDDYDTAIAAQQIKVFQGDDADGMILDLQAPFLYSSGSPDSAFEVNSLSTNAVELMPQIVYAEGAGRDCGHDQALMLQIDNLIDYKTGINMPGLLPDAVGNPDAIKYELVYLAPIFLTKEVLTNAVIRELLVAVVHRSSTGASATVRVTLARSRPSGDGRFGVNRGAVYSEMTRTTTSTSWQVSTATALDCRVKDASGFAWLLIECSRYAETFGICQASESIRTQPSAWVDP